MDRGVTGGKSTREAKITEAQQKLYRNGDGLYYPASNVKRSLLGGCKMASLKYGKKGLAPFLEATVFLQPAELAFGVKEADFLDERMGRIPPKTGAAAIIRRPGLNAGWKLAFDLVVVDDRIPDDHIKQALEEAGLLCGIGSFRPEFGRFTVKRFERSAAQRSLA